MRESSQSLVIVVSLIALLLSPARCAWWPKKGSEVQKLTHDEEDGEPVPFQRQRNALLVDHRSAFEVEMVGLPGAEKGNKLLEELKAKLENSCFHNAYASLFNSCRVVLNDENMKLRLAYRFADCFLRSSGMEPLKHCPEMIPIQECTKSLNDHRYQILTSFFIDIAAMCHYLQSEAFKLETEVVVMKLKSSSHFVESKLTTMHVQLKTIFDNSDRIYKTQQLLEQEAHTMTQNIGEMHQDINKGLGHLKEYAEETNKYMETVSTLQKDMTEQQEKMTNQQRILAENLQEEISTLSTKADEIGVNVIKSLSNQKELLAGQHAALATLADMKKVSEYTLEESKKLQEIHQQLSEKSKAILNAQEVFGTKQTIIFASLERLFSLHNTMLTDFRALKAVLFYVPVTILIYLITGTRKTNDARPFLYFGLCLSFGAEFWSLRLLKLDPLDSVRFQQNSTYIRGTYSALALCYVLYCILTFRDYACLSYLMLQDMQKKIEKNARGKSHSDHNRKSKKASPSRSHGITFKDYLDQHESESSSDDPDYDPDEDSDFV